MIFKVCLLCMSNLSSCGSIIAAIRVSLFWDLARNVWDRLDALLGFEEGGMCVALGCCLEGLLVPLSAAVGVL